MCIRDRIVISYIIISRNDNSVGHMIAMIVAVFIGYECYIMPVYIKTAAVLTAASFMLWWYLYQAKEKPFKKTTILAVEFLGILGSLVSWKIFLGTSFMMIVVLFFCFYTASSWNLPTKSFNPSDCAESSSLVAEDSSAVAEFDCTTSDI